MTELPLPACKPLIYSLESIFLQLPHFTDDIVAENTTIFKPFLLWRNPWSIKHHPIHIGYCNFMIDLSLVSAKLHKHLLTKIRFHTVSAPKRNISNNIMILIIQQN